jgi:hypothetical protein
MLISWWLPTGAHHVTTPSHHDRVLRLMAFNLVLRTWVPCACVQHYNNKMASSFLKFKLVINLTHGRIRRPRQIVRLIRNRERMLQLLFYSKSWCERFIIKTFLIVQISRNLSWLFRGIICGLFKNIGAFN